MIENMAVLHISEADLARDVHAVLEKVRGGAEIAIEQDLRPVAVMKRLRPGRSIDESIALAKEYDTRLGYEPVPDPGFAEDVQTAIGAHPETLDTSAWD